jgi:hypothetical protein
MKGMSKTQMLMIQDAKVENQLRMSHYKAPRSAWKSSRRAFQLTMGYKSMKVMSKSEMPPIQYGKVSNPLRMSHCKSRRNPWNSSHTAFQTDDGIQIDESDGQRLNAHDSIRETVQPLSNLTLEINRFPKKEWRPNDSICPGIIIVSAEPKHFMIESHSQFTRKWSMILKQELPDPIEMSSGVVQSKAP